MVNYLDHESSRVLASPVDLTGRDVALTARTKHGSSVAADAKCELAQAEVVAE
jgi:hypothetical protein